MGSSVSKPLFDLVEWSKWFLVHVIFIVSFPSNPLWFTRHAWNVWKHVADIYHAVFPKRFFRRKNSHYRIRCKCLRVACVICFYGAITDKEKRVSSTWVLRSPFTHRWHLHSRFTFIVSIIVELWWFSNLGDSFFSALSKRVFAWCPR